MKKNVEKKKRKSIISLFDGNSNVLDPGSAAIYIKPDPRHNSNFLLLHGGARAAPRWTSRVLPSPPPSPEIPSCQLSTLSKFSIEILLASSEKLFINQSKLARINFVEVKRLMKKRKRRYGENEQSFFEMRKMFSEITPFSISPIESRFDASPPPPLKYIVHPFRDSSQFTG